MCVRYSFIETNRFEATFIKYTHWKILHVKLSTRPLLPQHNDNYNLILWWQFSLSHRHTSKHTPAHKFILIIYTKKLNKYWNKIDWTKIDKLSSNQFNLAEAKTLRQVQSFLWAHKREAICLCVCVSRFTICITPKWNIICQLECRI